VGKGNRFDPLVGIILLLLGIFFVLLVILAWAQIYGGGWQTVAQGVASYIIYIVAFGVVVSAIFLMASRRR
jgi:hypothetical protein